MAASSDDRTQMRQRILALVRDYPGLHYREVARQLDTSVALVEYHVPYLVRNGLIRVEADERYQRLYAVERDPLPDEHRTWMAVLRQPNPLHIILWMLDVGGPVRHGEMAQALEMGKSKLTFHLQKLIRAGLVEKAPSGEFGLLDGAATAELLLTHRPTSDLRDRFAGLWASFYDR